MLLMALSQDGVLDTNQLPVVKEQLHDITPKIMKAMNLVEATVTNNTGMNKGIADTPRRAALLAFKAHISQA